MKIKLIESVTLDDYKTILPDIRYSWLEKAYNTVNTLYMLAATEKAKVVGYSVFLTYKAKNAYPLLLYITVAEEYEGTGIATKLFNIACKVLKDLNYKKISLSLLAGEDSEDFFIKQGFGFVGNKIYLTYNGAELSGSKIGQNLNQAKPLISKVRRINELSPIQIKSFSQIRSQGTYNHDILKRDNEELSFFVPDDDICAYMSVIQDANQNFLLTDMFIKKSSHASLAIPALFSYFLANKSLKFKKNASVTLFVESRNNYEAMVDTFGEPLNSAWSVAYEAEIGGE